MLAIVFPYVCSLLMKEINLNDIIDLEKIYLNIIINYVQFSIWTLFQVKQNLQTI